MTTIVFASSKGGAGKTTSAFLLATELASRGKSVTLIDADPNHPIEGWKKRGGVLESLNIICNDSEEAIMDEIQEASQKSSFVLVDLEGTANLSVAYSISLADLVIVPSQRSTLDAGEANKAIKLVRLQEKVANRTIPVSLLLTRTSAAIRSKGLKRMIEGLEKHGVDSFVTELNEREAFKAVFDHTSTLCGLSAAQVSGLEKARLNCSEFAAEVIKKIATNRTKESIVLESVTEEERV